MLFFIVFLFFVVVCEVFLFVCFSAMEGRWGQFLVFLCFRKEMPLLDFFPLFLTGIMQLMSIPSKKHFLASRLTPDMERKITFLLFQVSCPGQCHPLWQCHQLYCFLTQHYVGSFGCEIVPDTLLNIGIFWDALKTMHSSDFASCVDCIWWVKSHRCALSSIPSVKI